MPEGEGPWLSRRSLKTVLQSLLLAELAAARGRRGVSFSSAAREIWSEDQRIGDGVLHCDSVEAMWLQAAVNEMFHLHEVDSVDALASDLRFGAWIDAIEGAWRLGVSRITFSTSGSTGKPKRCMHSFENLQTEVRYLAALFSDCRRVIAATPAHHIYGFILTALLPDALGVESLDASDLAAGRLAAELGNGDLIVTFPEKWAWIERSLPQIPPGVAGVISTAPCPPGLVDALIAKGLSAITDIYGSSETAGVATRCLPRENHYELMPHWRLVSADPVLLVRDDESRHSPPDLLVFRTDGRFQIAGRTDGAVQVGGTNVWPARIAERMHAIQGVAKVVVRLMREDEGNRLKAFVVPASGILGEDLLHDVEIWIERNLPAPQRPKAIAFGSELPTSAIGKLADW